ncbi:MAG: hypothetical protein EHM64_07085 [Ignavibacteriae bacterium]|nr:MAG: hypothetical protein EHM64_07085 [Ignavibacteriota bacterium]
MKMAARVLVVSILVVLSLGILGAQTVQGINVQDRTKAVTNALDAVDQQIDYSTALRFISNLKNGIAFNLNTSARVKTKTVAGGYLTRLSLEKVMSQPAAVAVHYYFGQDDSAKPIIVIFGVDSAGKDLVSGTIMATAAPVPCPPFCGAGAE